MDKDRFFRSFIDTDYKMTIKSIIIHETPVQVSL